MTEVLKLLAAGWAGLLDGMAPASLAHPMSTCNGILKQEQKRV